MMFDIVKVVRVLSFYSCLKFFLFWTLVLGFTVLFLIPGNYLANEIFDWWDKAQHAFIFAFLTMMANLIYRSKLKMIFFCLVLYGAVIELLQSYTGWRQGEFYDWIADCIGVICVSVLIWIYESLKSKHTLIG